MDPNVNALAGAQADSYPFTKQNDFQQYAYDGMAGERAQAEHGFEAANTTSQFVTVDAMEVDAILANSTSSATTSKGDSAPEVRTQVMQHHTLVHLEAREYEFLRLDMTGKMLPDCQMVKCLLMDETGRDQYFNQSALQAHQLEPNITRGTLYRITFVMWTSYGLGQWLERYEEYKLRGAVLPDCNVELHIMGHLVNNENFRAWIPRNESHGAFIGVYKHIEAWMKRVQELPSNATVLLVFTCFWLDYRSLNAISERCGLHTREIKCRFEGVCPNFPRSGFHIKQTLSAVTGIEVPERVGIDRATRYLLVDHGCRGFNFVGSPNAA